MVQPLRVAVAALLLGGCYVHANGMQTPTPTLHGRPAVAYAVPFPRGRSLGVLYIPAEGEEEEDAQPNASPPARRLDPASARMAIEAIDLAPCRAARGARGAGLVRVFFARDGRVLDVIVDEPRSWSTSSVECVSERLLRARVQSFDTGHIWVGAWLSVEKEGR